MFPIFVSRCFRAFGFKGLKLRRGMKPGVLPGGWPSQRQCDNHLCGSHGQDVLPVLPPLTGRPVAAAALIAPTLAVAAGSRSKEIREVLGQARSHTSECCTHGCFRKCGEVTHKTALVLGWGLGKTPKPKPQTLKHLGLRVFGLGWHRHEKPRTTIQAAQTS